MDNKTFGAVYKSSYKFLILKKMFIGTYCTCRLVEILLGKKNLLFQFDYHLAMKAKIFKPPGFLLCLENIINFLCLF